MKDHMTQFENFVEDAEQREQNVYDFEDIRFAEIYVDDETPKRKLKKMKRSQYEQQ